MPLLASRPSLAALALSAALALLAPAPARAAPPSAPSSNWAGYAVHRAGVEFRLVSGTWRVPSASCPAGRSSYSSTWVGLGGYSLHSPALEQIGTETDCSARGRVLTSAWYELVPSRSRAARLLVHPGDTVTATVRDSGRLVTLILTDASTGQRFSRSLDVSVLDLSSAEWIEEAPSRCITATGSCRVLALADFGTVAFTHAYAVDGRGQRGAILAPAWNRTRLWLARSGSHLVSERLHALAEPTALGYGGGAFQIRYLGRSTA